MTKVQAIVPGKVILSGEHSVVYGKMALVIAAASYITTTVEKHPSSSDILFTVIYEDKCQNLTFTPLTLKKLYRRLEQRYRFFSQGKISIAEVLHDSLDIIPFAFALFCQQQNIALEPALQITLQIELPIGCGMGSSAATALSILYATSAYYRRKTSPETYFDYAMTCENLCHGTPSGLDPFICLHGGAVQFQEQKKMFLNLPVIHWSLALTGKPNSTTGECVLHVRNTIGEKSCIWSEFEAVTDQLLQGILQNKKKQIRDAVRKNHRLLVRLGVVPHPIQSFIADIEKFGGAAKITGAGSIRGNHAGAVLIYTENKPEELGYPYTIVSLEKDQHGARIL